MTAGGRGGGGGGAGEKEGKKILPGQRRDPLGSGGGGR